MCSTQWDCIWYVFGDVVTVCGFISNVWAAARKTKSHNVICVEKDKFDLESSSQVCDYDFGLLSESNGGAIRLRWVISYRTHTRTPQAVCPK